MACGVVPKLETVVCGVVGPKPSVVICGVVDPKLRAVCCPLPKPDAVVLKAEVVAGVVCGVPKVKPPGCWLLPNMKPPGDAVVVVCGVPNDKPPAVCPGELN